MRLIKLKVVQKKSKINKIFKKICLFSQNSYFTLRCKTAYISDKLYGWNWFFSLFFIKRNIRLPNSEKRYSLNQVILTKKLEKMKKSVKISIFRRLPINKTEKGYSLLNQLKKTHLKVCRNSACMNSWDIMLLDWLLFELH